MFTPTRIVAALGLTALLGVPAAVSAGSATSNIAVSATVSQTCTIANGTMAFNSYDPVGTNAATDLAATGTVAVACTKNASGVTIALDNGTHYASSTRNMAGAAHADMLAYSLYQDAAHTQAWDASANKYALAAPTSKAAQTLNIYGVVPKAQDVSVDSYTDTVVATVNF
jgi:spore coat protein U-like protein